MKHLIVLQPVITEKSMSLAGNHWYTFKANLSLNKFEIAGAIEEQFKVHVTKIKTINMKGKSKRAGRKRLLTKTTGWKKAMVRLKSGEKIDLFSVEEKPVGSVKK